MQDFFVQEYIETILGFVSTPLLFGFAMTTMLEFISYGIFKAFSLVNMKKY